MFYALHMVISSQSSHSPIIFTLSCNLPSKPSLFQAIFLLFIQYVSILETSELVAGGKTVVVVHIFRFGNDKIVELWDIGEAIPKRAFK